MQREETYQNEYLICFKNVVYILKILAVFPFIRFNEGTRLGRLSSVIVTIISLTIYTIMVVREGKYIHRTYFILHREFNFLNIIRFFLQSSMRLIVIMFPFLMWNKNSYLKNYWNNWMIFQIEMAKLTKTWFKSTTARYQIKRLFFISTISITTISIMLATLQRKSIATNLFSALYVLHALSNVIIYWIFNNIFITAVSKKIINLVQQALRKGNVADLAYLIDLWIMLCDLNQQFIDGHSIIFLIMFSETVIVGVLSVFTAVLFFVYYNDESLGLTYIFATFICTVGIMTFCESANSVVNHMVYKLKNQLLEEKLDIQNKPLLKVILLFLHTIETRNPKVTFKGYMTIDRSVVSMILTAAINFLVVLKQFSPQYQY